jgi:hypothetical protein
MKKKAEEKIGPPPNYLDNIAAAPQKYARAMQFIKDHPLPDIPPLKDR